MASPGRISLLAPGGADIDLLWADARDRDFPSKHPAINCHIHLPPNFSAFDRPAQAVDMARREGIRLLGTSNYYDFTVYTRFAADLEAAGTLPLFGTEIIALDDALVREGVKVNDPGNPGKIYLCGKAIVNFRSMSPGAATILLRIRGNDARRMAAMIQALNTVAAERGVELGLAEPAVIRAVADRAGVAVETVCLQERHVARAVQERLFAEGDAARRDRVTRLLGADLADCTDPVKVQEEIRSRLLKSGKPAFVAESYITLDEAIRLILALGGIPCYPVLADGTKPITAFEGPTDRLLGHLAARGIPMAEFIPLRNDPNVLETYVLALRRAGIVVTAGTEHNTVAMPPLAPACRGGAPIPPAVAEIFHEGACVALAHQFLVLNGRMGYVDAHGRLNPDYPTAEDRIESFAKLGALLMDRAR